MRINKHLNWLTAGGRRRWEGCQQSRGQVHVAGAAGLAHAVSKRGRQAPLAQNVGCAYEER